VAYTHTYIYIYILTRMTNCGVVSSVTGRDAKRVVYINPLHQAVGYAQREKYVF
jgi:hypothetical protein